MTSTKNIEALLERLSSLDMKKEDVIRKGKTTLEAAEYAKNFWGVARGSLPKNAIKEGTDGSGGFLVPDEFERSFVEALENQSTLRRLGTVIQTRHDLKIPTVSEHGSAEWVDEGAAIPESDEPFNQLILSAYKLGTMTIVSEELLEDSGFDLEKFIAKEFSRRIAVKEEEAFLKGDGVNKPQGILNSAPVGTVTSKSGTLTMDDAIDLFFSVNMRYRLQSSWLMSGDAYKALYSCRTGFGQNIWQPSLTEGEPDMLLNRPVVIADALPCVDANSKPILFGDFSYFWIGDRGKRSLKRLNELYAAKGQVGFMLSQRVDAKLVLPEALKSLQIKE